MMTAQTQHDACKGGRAGGRGQQIVSLSTSQRDGTVTGEMRDLANIRLLSEAEGRVSVRGDKISSFSSSFFFPHFSPEFLNISPRAVGRGCGEGPQRLAGEALLLPCVRDRTDLMNVWTWQHGRSASALKDHSDAFGVPPIGERIHLCLWALPACCQAHKEQVK